MMSSLMNGTSSLTSAGVISRASMPQVLVVVHREDEVRCVTGRAARVGQRTLVEQDHVGPAQACQVADEAVADDAGADDDDFG